MSSPSASLLLEFSKLQYHLAGVVASEKKIKAILQNFDCEKTKVVKDYMSKSSNLFCETCNLKCTGPKQLSAHLKGDRHLDMVKMQRNGGSSSQQAANSESQKVILKRYQGLPKGYLITLKNFKSDVPSGWVVDTESASSEDDRKVRGTVYGKLTTPPAKGKVFEKDWNSEIVPLDFFEKELARRVGFALSDDLLSKNIPVRGYTIEAQSYIGLPDTTRVTTGNDNIPANLLVVTQESGKVTVIGKIENPLSKEYIFPVDWKSFVKPLSVEETTAIQKVQIEYQPLGVESASARIEY